MRTFMQGDKVSNHNKNLIAHYEQWLETTMAERKALISGGNYLGAEVVRLGHLIYDIRNIIKGLK